MIVPFFYTWSMIMTTNNQTFQPIQKPLSLFFAAGGNAGILGYDAGHPYQSYVPNKEENYIHRREFVREYRSWHNEPGEMGLMIVGPTGSGKSTGVLAINHFLNIPTIVVQCHRDMSLLELKGTMQFVTDSDTLQSVTKYVLGPISMAFKYGFTLVLEENNLLDPGVNAGLNEIIRGNTLMIEQTGEVIQRHQMFRIIATGNDWGRGDAEVRLAGINQQNSAFLNRWWKFEMGYPTDTEENEILESKMPNLPEEIGKKMVEVANFIRPSIRGVGKDDKKAQLDVDFSTRTLIEWADKTLRFAKAPNPVQYALDIVLLRACNDAERTTIEEACLAKMGKLFAK